MTLSFFRRHRTMFMVLMFASLVSMLLWGSWTYIEQKLEAWFGSSGMRQAVGSIDGRSVRFRELIEFKESLRMAVLADLTFSVGLSPQAMAPEIRGRLFELYLQILGSQYPWVGIAVQERADPAKVMVWLALYQEACDRGFRMTDLDVEAYLKAVTDRGLPAEQVKQVIAQQSRGQQDRFHEAVRTERTLRAYVHWLGETLAGATEPELRRAFLQVDERLKVRLALFRAKDFAAEVGDIPEPALQEQFHKHKSQPRGQGEGGCGYRIPDRVALEYLVADPKDFADAAAAKVTDDLVRQYYEAMKDREFVVDEKTPEPAKDEKAADPAKPAEKKYKPLADVRDDIRKKILDRQAAVLARERLQSDVLEIHSTKRGTSLGVWADGKQVRHVVVPGVHAADDLAKLEGLGKAVRGEETFPATALALVDLVGAEKARLAVGEISELFTDADGRAYAFRVTRLDRSREPTGLDEVREQVLADVRQARAFDLAREKARGLLEAAADKGLEAAAQAAKVALVTTGWCTRQRPMPEAPEEIAASRVLVSECFRMLADKRRRTLVTLAEDAVAVVAEVVEGRPPREAAFQDQRAELAASVGGDLARAALTQVLEPGAIRRRMSVVIELPERIGGPEGEDEAGGE